MYKISRAVLLLVTIYLVGCADTAVLEFFGEPETGKVVFKAGDVCRSTQFNLSRFQDITMGFLPVRSSLGGGLGEDVVTKYIYENMAARFKNINFISNAEVSQSFSDMEMWEDYFAYLEKYHQDSVSQANFDELKGLYRKLGASYIININSDYTPVNKYPNVFETNIQIQIWDINNGKKVWEGFGRGQDIVYSADNIEAVRQKMVDWVCRRMAEEMAGGMATTGLTADSDNM